MEDHREEPPSKRIWSMPQVARRPMLLYLYAGPYRTDSVCRYMHELGWDCQEVDIEARSQDDLLDDDTWTGILQKIRQGCYDGLLASPPCGTFSMARSDFDGGPKKLRGPTMPDLMGYRDLDPASKLEVKTGNILADRAAEAAEMFAEDAKPWCIEQPARREGNPSMFGLPKFQRLANRADAKFTKFSQCQFGQKFRKDTEVLGNVDTSGWPKECNHPSQWWIIPWNGKRSYGPHPPLKGRQMAIPESEWDRSMLRWEEPKGPYLTKSTAHYPGELNRAFAEAFANFRVTQGKPSKVVDVDVEPMNHSDLPVPKFTVNQGAPANDADDSVGGLKRPYRSMGKVPGLVNLGVQIRNLIDRFCEQHPDFSSSYIEALGKDSDVSFPGDANLINDLRLQVGNLLMRMHPNPDPARLGALNDSPPDTCLKANFMELWAEAARDPGCRLIQWLKEGAPGGLRLHPDLDGLFPLVTDDDDPQFQWDMLSTDFQEFTNYSGVEENPEAAKAISTYVSKGYLSVHDCLESCINELGGDEPVLSRLGCIVKRKVNEFGVEIEKRRASFWMRSSLG